MQNADRRFVAFRSIPLFGTLLQVISWLFLEGTRIHTSLSTPTSRNTLSHTDPHVHAPHIRAHISRNTPLRSREYLRLLVVWVRPKLGVRPTLEKCGASFCGLGPPPFCSRLSHHARRTTIRRGQGRTSSRNGVKRLPLRYGFVSLFAVGGRG